LLKQEDIYVVIVLLNLYHFHAVYSVHCDEANKLT